MNVAVRVPNTPTIGVAHEFASRPSSAQLFLGAAAVAAALASFSPVLIELVHRWNVQEEYSHGYLIPLISAWLLWTRRDALSASIGTPSVACLPVIMVAVGLSILGELSAVFVLSQISFVMLLMGIVLGFGGFSFLRVCFIPLAYLLFAIPLPYFIDAALTLRLQLLSSELGVFFIRLFQIPVYLDGNVIDLGIYKLQVVEACSGLRYLYPLLSLSFLSAYLFQERPWQRILIFLSGIPIAIGMNGFRIGLVGLLVDNWGTKMADGALHFFEGWVVFLACSALLVGEMWTLARFSGYRFFEIFHAPNMSITSVKEAYDKPLWIGVATLLIICLAGAGIFLVANRSEVIPKRQQFVQFPRQLGNWRGRMEVLDNDTEQVLKMDDYVLANYTRADAKAVNFYVAYYASQRKNESPHSPTVCLPGSGWIITRTETKAFKFGGAEYQLNRTIIQKGSERDLVYYWFDERGRTVANEYWAKWYLLVDAVTMNRTDGALVRLVTRIAPEESEGDADTRLEAFMKAALPRLPAYLPSGSTETAALN